MSLSQIIIGIIVTALGFLATWKSNWILKNFGRVPWAEKHLSYEGGSRLFYKIIGIITIFIGLFLITGIWHDLLGGISNLFIK